MSQSNDSVVQDKGQPGEDVLNVEVCLFAAGVVLNHAFFMNVGLNGETKESITPAERPGWKIFCTVMFPVHVILIRNIYLGINLENFYSCFFCTL